MSLLSKRRAEAQQQAARGVPQYLIPGAYSERGPDYEDYVNNDDTTVMVGGVTNQQEPPPPERQTTTTTFEAVVVDAPPLVPAQVDTTCTIHDRRLQIAVILLLLVVMGVVLGVVFGLPSASDDNSTPPSASPTTSVPTTLTWVQAGGLDGILDGASLSLSPDGTRLAVVDAANIVQVYQDDGTQLGEAIDAPASSLSLSSADHLAVGSANATTTGQVSVFKLLNGVWTRIGSTISTQAWTVVLSKDGTVLAVETTDSVQVYHRVNDDEWSPRGNSIPTTSVRVDQGRAYSRLAMNHDGTVLIVDLSVYNYENDQWTTGVRLPIDSNPPNTPVSISGDGRVVAIAQPQSNINGLNSGRVVVFQLDGRQWTQKGQSIIGDGQINGFWGYSHALSEDGSRIAIMNNALDQNLAFVFRLEGLRWIRLLEEVPQALSNGTIAMSEDASRVAVGGQDLVRLYDIVSG